MKEKSVSDALLLAFYAPAIAQPVQPLRFGGRCEKHLSVKPCQQCADGVPASSLNPLFSQPVQPAIPNAMMDITDMFQLESMTPVEGYDEIYRHYATTFGRTPDAFMQKVVGETKERLLMWWGAHREAVREALVAYEAAAPSQPAQPDECGNTPYDEGPFTIAQPVQPEPVAFYDPANNSRKESFVWAHDYPAGAGTSNVALYPAAAPLIAQPAPATFSTAPACLNTNDKAMWILGWNECLAAISSTKETM